MKCEEAEERIYLYRELSQQEQHELDQHIATCASCQLLQQSIQRISVLMKSADNVQMKPSNPEQLTQRIMTSIKKKEAPQKFLSTFIQYVESHFVKYSFAALSVFLVTVFVIEYSQERVVLRQNVTVTQDGPTLDTKEFHQRFYQRKQNKEEQPVSHYSHYKNLYSNKTL
jgi:hypothetical protein